MCFVVSDLVKHVISFSFAFLLATGGSGLRSCLFSSCSSQLPQQEIGVIIHSRAMATSTFSRSLPSPTRHTHQAKSPPPGTESQGIPFPTPPGLSFSSSLLSSFFDGFPSHQFSLAARCPHCAPKALRAPDTATPVLLWAPTSVAPAAGPRDRFGPRTAPRAQGQP